MQKAPADKSAEKPNQNVPAAEPVNNCLLCHGNKDVWEGETLNRYVTEKDFHNDIHWQKGLRCVDCHGGNPKTDEVNLAHLKEDGFRLIKSPADIPEFCGRCHSDIEYMRRYQPSPRTDQLAEYWTSGHGKHLKTGDMKVATCISCHDRPHGSGKETGKHGILPASDLNSPVYRTPRGRDLREVPRRQGADGRPPLRRQAVALRRIRQVAAERPWPRNDGSRRSHRPDLQQLPRQPRRCRRRSAPWPTPVEPVTAKMRSSSARR